MTDVVKMCDVIDNCEDCPKYGDDCDGDKMTEHTDLISRADAIGAVDKQFIIDAIPICKEIRMAIIQLLKGIPSADAVQGEWIRKVKEYNDCDGHRVVYWHECSVCGARPLYTRFVNEKLTNYCPNCGARMKGGEAE